MSMTFLDHSTLENKQVRTDKLTIGRSAHGRGGSRDGRSRNNTCLGLPLRRRVQHRGSVATPCMSRTESSRLHGLFE
jgi:hypothetical protein